MVEFVGAVLVLLLLWAAVATVIELLSEHNDEYTHMMSSPFTQVEHRAIERTTFSEYVR